MRKKIRSIHIILFVMLFLVGNFIDISTIHTEAGSAFLMENDMTIYIVIFDKAAYRISSKLFLILHLISMIIM